VPVARTGSGEAESEEFAADGGPATKATVAVAVKLAGVVMLRVFVSAFVETIEPVATPEAFVTAAG